MYKVDFHNDWDPVFFESFEDLIEAMSLDMDLDGDPDLGPVPVLYQGRPFATVGLVFEAR